MKADETKEKTKKTNKKKVPTTVFVNVSNTRFSIVRHSVEDMGYKITESTTKPLLFWCDSGGNFEFASQLSQWQFYNHFPGTWAIARKVDLARNIEKMARLLPEYYNFHPKSFIIPTQFSEMETYMNSISKKKSRRTFIVKPDRGSFGKGIVLIQDADAIIDWVDSAIAQQYIEPYLIDGLKFDLRIYALVSSIEPLRIYLFNEGIGRFCTELYEKPKSNNLELSYAHLTNYALNKNNPNFQQPTDADHADTGHKRSLTCIIEHMRKEGIDTDELISSIEDIIRLTVISIQPYLSTNYKTAIPSVNDKKSRCFEILGFDILIDKKLKPWLLEVNWSPSLATESPFDKVLKQNVITDTLKIINIPPNFKQLVMKRKRAISMRRTIGKESTDDIDSLWDPEEETKISEATGWKLIYPINDSNSKYEKTEIALAISKASPVGASVSLAQARILKESIISQLKEKNPQFKQTPQISDKAKSPKEPSNANASQKSNQNPSSKPIAGRRLLNPINSPNGQKTANTYKFSGPPNQSHHLLRPQQQSQHSQRQQNESLHQMKIQKTASSTVVPNATFASTFSPPQTAQTTNSLTISGYPQFKPSFINEEEERQRKFNLKRQEILAQSLSISSYCCTMAFSRSASAKIAASVSAGKETAAETVLKLNGVGNLNTHIAPNASAPLGMPRLLSLSLPGGNGTKGAKNQSITKNAANQSVFKPTMAIQRQTLFC